MPKYHLYNVKFIKNVTIEIEAASPEDAISAASQLMADDGMMWEKSVDEITCEEIDTGFYCPLCGSTLKRYDSNPDLYYCLNEDDCGTEWIIKITPEGKVTGVYRSGKFSF